MTNGSNRSQPDQECDDPTREFVIESIGKAYDKNMTIAVILRPPAGDATPGTLIISAPQPSESTKEYVTRLFEFR